MNINYGMEIVRATEIAALTAARIQGLGDDQDILGTSRAALCKILNRLSIEGHLVNDRFRAIDESDSLQAVVGNGNPDNPKMDLMTLALEGYQSASDGKNNSTSLAVIAEKDAIQPVPNLSMYKVVVGPEVGDVIDINQPPIVNVKRAARALKKYTENVTVCILNQARHRQLIREIRSCGARIKLIEEGEVSGCLAAITGQKADIYIGYGYAAEAAMVAAAISCLGGYFEGKVLYENDRDREESHKHGITDLEKIFRVEDLIHSKKELAIAATGITDGEFLEGVRFTSNGAITHSFVARAETRTYRNIETTHFFDFKPVF